MEYSKLRSLTPEDISVLEKSGCTATDWNTVQVTDDTSLALIRNVDFEGTVAIGALSRIDGRRTGISNARIIDCFIGDNVYIRNIGRQIANATIGDEAVIENVASIEFEPEAPCGLGVVASVLDETGSRPVKFYSGLSSQIATLMAMKPRWAEETLFPMLDDMAEEKPLSHSIGAGAEVTDCGPILNVHIADEVRVAGARRLVNGAIINNAASKRALAFVGSGVDAENFMIVDGCADSGAIIRNTFIGQGAILEKGFTSHDSVFFANCSLENGEACAVFAGPYTVSMHKATLLIGVMTSFMNAGSGTNQSNHMYKLGPVHWGILERGVKTSSGSYIMWGARIAPFSLVMGPHKNHPDTSEFPFSYLFGDDKGATSVVPAMMLRSCGLLRDEKKWPTRDRRLKRKLPMLDRINFAVLNPITSSRILDALSLMRELLLKPADDDGFLRYKGMKLRRAHLQRAEIIYTEALCKYLSGVLPDNEFPERTADTAAEWVDLGGQIVTRDVIDKVLQAESLEEIDAILDAENEAFADKQLAWIGNAFPDEWRQRKAEIPIGADAFDRHVEEDRTMYRDNLSAEHSMLSL